jgi:hypothetical protein
MADEVAAPTPGTGESGDNTEPEAPADNLSGSQIKRLGGGEDGLKADLAAERKRRQAIEAQLKELEPLAAKAQKLEEAQKTEAQKLSEKLAKANEEAAAARAEALRFRIASKHQISDEDAETFLTGSDEETLTRQAERLVALSSAGASGPSGSRTPVENLRPGALPSPPQQTLAEQIAAAEAAKDWTTAGQLKTQQLVELQKQTT